MPKTTSHNTSNQPNYSLFNFDPNYFQYSGVNATSMALASALAYEPGAEAEKQALAWGFPKFNFLQGTRRISDTQAYITGNDKLIILAFRGTEQKIQDWATDLNFIKTEGPLGNVHEGFNSAFNSVIVSLTKSLFEFRDNQQPIWVTGHSLGAALATLAVAAFTEFGLEVSGLYTFGSPRVGDQRFEEALRAKMGDRIFRVVNRNDIVPRVPPSLAGYKHVGEVVLFDEKGMLKQEPNAWEQLKVQIKVQLTKDLLNKDISSVSHHLLGGSEGYLAALIKNL